jgi:hypothetical protein
LLKEALKYVPKHYRDLKSTFDYRQKDFQQNLLTEHLDELKEEFGYSKWRQKQTQSVARAAEYDQKVKLTMQYKKA